MCVRGSGCRERKVWGMKVVYIVMKRVKIGRTIEQRVDMCTVEKKRSWKEEREGVLRALCTDMHCNVLKKGIFVDLKSSKN